MNKTFNFQILSYDDDFLDYSEPVVIHGLPEATNLIFYAEDIFLLEELQIGDTIVLSDHSRWERLT